MALFLFPCLYLALRNNTNPNKFSRVRGCYASSQSPDWEVTRQAPACKTNFQAEVGNERQKTCSPFRPKKTLNKFFDRLNGERQGVDSVRGELAPQALPSVVEP